MFVSPVRDKMKLLAHPTFCEHRRLDLMTEKITHGAKKKMA